MCASTNLSALYTGHGQWLGLNKLLQILLALLCSAIPVWSQAAVTYQYSGPTFNGPGLCSNGSDGGIFGGPCVIGTGNVIMTATITLPSSSYTGCVANDDIAGPFNPVPVTVTATAFGSTFTTSNIFRYAFCFSNGQLSNGAGSVTLEFVSLGSGLGSKLATIYTTSGIGDGAYVGTATTISNNNLVYSWIEGSVNTTGTWTPAPVCQTTSLQIAVGLRGADRVAHDTTGCPTANSLQIVTKSVPSAASGLPYGPVNLKALGGSNSGYTWCVQSPAGCVSSGPPLPPGFKLITDGLSIYGVLSSMGIPAAAEGSYPFTVQVTDSAGNPATQQLTLVVTHCPFNISVRPNWTFNQPPMRASFTAPPAYVSLTAAANACGFASFDWASQVTHAGPLFVYQATSTGGKGPLLQAPWNDPPPGGYYNVPNSQSPPYLNANPFFYNPLYVDNAHCKGGNFQDGTCAGMITDGNTLNFYDAPGDPCEVGGAAWKAGSPQCGSSTFQGFTTQLVGVCGYVPPPFVPSPLCPSSGEPSPPLYQWTWETNWDACPPMSPTNPNCGVVSGGIYEGQTISSSSLGPGTGEVKVTSINNAQLPSAISPSQAATTASGLSYSRVTQTFNGTVTITNTGTSLISGPLQILFLGLPANVSLVNATGNLSGTPYITIAASNDKQVLWTLQNVIFKNGETASGTFVVDAQPTNGFYIVDSWNVTFTGLPAGFPTGSSGTANRASCSTPGCAFICSNPADASCSAGTGYYQTTPVQDALDVGAGTGAIGAGTGLTTGMALLANNLFPPTVGVTVPLLVSTPATQESYISAYNFSTGQYADVGNLVSGSIAQSVAPTITGAGLAPGQSVTLSVQFKNPSNATINLTPAIYSGSIN